MLLQFSVENFMSIKKEATLDLSATADKSLQENLTSFGKKQYLSTIGIFGANASGKTTVCKALLIAVMLMRTSNLRQVGERLAGIVPFIFDAKTQGQPSVFKFLFAQDGIKYYYSFKATNKEILSEVLYKYESRKPKLLFERNNENAYKFPKGEEKLLNEIKAKNTPNKFFLATATNWNSESTKNAYLWFEHGIDIICDGAIDNTFNLQPYLNEDNKLKDFTLNLLREADISINNFAVEQISGNLVNPTGNLPFTKVGFVHITTEHIVEEHGKNEKSFQLELENESQGTKLLFKLAPLLEETFVKGKVLCIDEIESHLHPELVQFLIRLFYNRKVNTNGAQLIFTTHNVVLMSLDLVRRDQLYFTQKDKKTSATELYSLAEFSVRKEENIRKAYLNGRFGAIPNIGEGDLL